MLKLKCVSMCMCMYVTQASDVQSQGDFAIICQVDFKTQKAQWDTLIEQWTKG